jgi:uncharacterized protein YndB with AHSA1/START domain
MTIVSAAVVIHRPIPDVFAFVTDTRNSLRWQSTGGLKSIRQKPEEGIGVGTRITETRHFMGRLSESTSEVTEYEPNRNYTRHLIAGSSPIKRRIYVFEPLAEGTRWTFTAQVQADGLFAIVEPLLVGMLKRGMEASMAEAKALLEQRVAERAR